MLLLLPPSERKVAALRGPVLGEVALSFPALDPIRAQVLDALTRLCANSPTKAMAVLGLGPTQRPLVADNARLAQTPCQPAITTYTGVLYEALAAESLSPAAHRRLVRNTAIASALFGLVRPDDLIPAYRLSGDVTLPRLGTVRSVWRAAVSGALAQSQGPILDLRSGAYAELGPIPPSATDRALVARVLLEKNGRRSVVSHHNKATKGRLVRALVEAGPLPRSITALLTSLDALGFTSELHDARHADVPDRLDIIVREV